MPDITTQPIIMPKDYAIVNLGNNFSIYVDGKRTQNYRSGWVSFKEVKSPVMAARKIQEWYPFMGALHSMTSETTPEMEQIKQGMVFGEPLPKPGTQVWGRFNTPYDIASPWWHVANCQDSRWAADWCADKLMWMIMTDQEFKKRLDAFKKEWPRVTPENAQTLIPQLMQQCFVNVKS